MIQSCNEIQECIAWGKDLTDAEQRHILLCAPCGEAAMQFMQLDAAMKDQLGVKAPEHFADQVMSRIYAESAIQPDWATSFSERLLSLLNLRPVQYGLVSVGILVSVANLIRFVFSVILPISA